VVLTLADMEGNETFDPAALGTADEVAEIRVADDAMVSKGAWHECMGCMCLVRVFWVRVCVL
jgi:T-complex protein 1 subunit alpha